ncbi:iporin [Strongylocentrotus purpuratus]|uniref:RUN domain-containing protein n=1 Tax=Strongylocentrotus purpuratus TaxID=7668 RepID=A0A7M7N1J5_STRPU|nr:iporin [Strongylocentrotus purpuratus]
MPPQVMKVSPREERLNSSIDVVQKRALVAEVNAAVAQLLAHFAQAKTGLPEEKAQLGNTWKTPDIGHLALHYLCPALMRILQDGLRPHSTSLLVGRIKNTTWTIVEATTQLGPGTRLLHELASTVSKDIRLRDSKLRTHAFFLGLLNIRCMESWLDHIRNHPESIKRLYEPTAFLSLINTAPFQQLFSDLLVAVQPLAQLPFNLDHGFEYGYIQAENMRQREKEQLMEQHKEGAQLGGLNTNSLVDARHHHTEGGNTTSGFPTVHLFGRAPRSDGAPSPRQNNTGMYSSMTVMRNMRRVTPAGRQESSEQPTTQGRLLRTVNSTPVENVSGHELEAGNGPTRPNPVNGQSNRWSLGWIKDFATSVAAQQPERAPSRTRQTSSKYDVGRRSKSVDVQGSSMVSQSFSVASGWGKIGSSFSKMWNQMMPPQPQQVEPKTVPSTPPPSPSMENEVRQVADGQSPCQHHPPTSPNKTSPGSPVKALCHHVTMTEGELCFSKGDVLTVDRQVDQEWLLCSHGNESGLVHVEYVQGLE